VEDSEKEERERKKRRQLKEAFEIQFLDALYFHDSSTQNLNLFSFSLSLFLPLSKTKKT